MRPTVVDRRPGAGDQDPGCCVYLAYGPNPEDRVNPQGTEWANAADAQVATDGAYVVVFGHLTEAGEPREMCPGTPYTVTHLQPNATGTGPGLPSPTPIPTAADAGTPHVIVGTSVPGGPILGPPLVPRTDTPVPTPHRYRRPARAPARRRAPNREPAAARRRARCGRPFLAL